MTEPQGKQEYTDTPAGWQKRWQVEMDAAEKATEAWRREGMEAVHRYRAEEQKKTERPPRRWNLFYANVETQGSLLFGRVPLVEASRRHGDPEDDVARVASTILTRLLNTDEDRTGPFSFPLSQALQDRLLPGHATVRVQKSGDIEYAHWQDFRWSAGARHWGEVWWVAFRTLVSKAQCVEFFGKELGERIPLNERRDSSENAEPTPWDRAEVWEIWDKSTRCVYWYVPGFSQTLGRGEKAAEGKEADPLGLRGFFPCPMPMAATLTTDKYLPRPDFFLAADLYDQIDTLQTRMDLLVKALRVAGAYDKQAGATLERLITDTAENELIPVDSWAALMEKGGLQGVMQWLPIEQVAKVLQALGIEQERLKFQLYEVTGMSDVLRGGGEVGETATGVTSKTRFASARLQRIHEDFARFASQAAGLRAEVIARHWKDEEIIARANMERSPDMALLNAAVALIRSPKSGYQIQVKPEGLSSSDFAQLRNERTEVVATIGNTVAALAPVAQALPGSGPGVMAFALQVLKWAVAGVRGGAEIEGAMDTAIDALQKQASQPAATPPDPKLQAAQLKGQQDEKKIQNELQADLVRMQAEVQADGQREATQRVQNVMEHGQKQALSNAMRPEPQPGAVRPGGVPR